MKSLEDAIDHWDRMANGGANDRPVARQCSLCIEFKKTSLLNCGECPVRKKTGRSGCEGTPFGAAYEEWHHHGHSAEFARRAAKMREFLIGLREKTEVEKLRDKNVELHNENIKLRHELAYVSIVARRVHAELKAILPVEGSVQVG
jgi:hypothetical protein